jgi:hypothetical protein
VSDAPRLNLFLDFSLDSAFRLCSSHSDRNLTPLWHGKTPLVRRQQSLPLRR